MTTANVRIAVAGAGQIGKRHIEMIHKNEHCVLSAIAIRLSSAAESSIYLPSRLPTESGPKGLPLAPASPMFSI